MRRWLERLMVDRLWLSRMVAMSPMRTSLFLSSVSTSISRFSMSAGFRSLFSPSSR